MPKNSKSNFNKDEQIKLKDKLIEIIGITKEKNYFSLWINGGPTGTP